MRKGMDQARIIQDFPDYRIVNAAEQYARAADMLAQVPPPGVIFPEVSCRAIAIELLLKSLSARTEQVPDKFSDWSVLYSKTAHGHPLLPLLDAMMPMDRQRLQEAFQVLTDKKIEDELVLCDGAFQAARYPYEKGQQRDFPLTQLTNLCAFLIGYVKSLRHEGRILSTSR